MPRLFRIPYRALHPRHGFLLAPDLLLDVSKQHGQRAVRRLGRAPLADPRKVVFGFRVEVSLQIKRHVGLVLAYTGRVDVFGNLENLGNVFKLRPGDIAALHELRFDGHTVIPSRHALWQRQQQQPLALALLRGLIQLRHVRQYRIPQIAQTLATLGYIRFQPM
jgi:hypothetical protein